eukprot:jgi/Botrbrau1/8318/Bobra.0081s0007.1
MDTLAKEVSVPLGAMLKGFPERAQLHPFERALLLLTVGPEAYERHQARVNNLRRTTLEVGKACTAQVAKAQSKKEVLAALEEGFERVQAVYNKAALALEDLKEMVKAVRRLPVVDPSLPTLALVGAPNVGKSSLVQILSSGTPEICNYPFTTRSIKMGHFFVDGRRHQVTDTPGLLNRPEDERNAMEELTLACLEHLPTSVLFVMDPTGDCGTSLADQWAIRSYLKERFADKPWLDVVSKADLLPPLLELNGEASPQQSRGTHVLDGTATSDAVVHAAEVEPFSSVQKKSLGTENREPTGFQTQALSPADSAFHWRASPDSAVQNGPRVHKTAESASPGGGGDCGTSGEGPSGGAVFDQCSLVREPAGATQPPGPLGGPQGPSGGSPHERGCDFNNVPVGASENEGRVVGDDLIIDVGPGYHDLGGPLGDPGGTGLSESVQVPMAPADLLALLPHAVLVSSKTEEGIDSLKKKVLLMFAAAARTTAPARPS